MFRLSSIRFLILLSVLCLAFAGCQTSGPPAETIPPGPEGQRDGWTTEEGPKTIDVEDGTARYFNEKGAHVKTETRKDFACQKDVCSTQAMKMTDHTRNGAWTEFKAKKWEVNTGIPDRYFTVRALQRGR